MFRKLHSNRNPEDTLFSSLRKEFAVYFNRLSAWLIKFLKDYPIVVFTLMVFLLLVSIVWSVGSHNHQKLTEQATKPELTKPVTLGFSRVLSKAQAIQESLAIKQEILALIRKDSIAGLTAADSIRLENAITRFHQLTITTEANEPH